MMQRNGFRRRAGTNRAEALAALAELGCTPREAASAYELIEVTRATLARRLPMTLELVDFYVGFERRLPVSR
jgi:hypothetical protein